MPYVLPTAAQFKARFPAFAEDYEDAYVDAILLEASASVDESWAEADYQPAIMYLTAHLIATDASGAHEEGEEIDTGGAGIASESFGPLSVSYARESSSAAVSTSGYESTVYGRRFLALLRRNKPSVVAI
jgi:hypothetical protein